MTIRRDVKELEEQGLVEREHGEADRPRATSVDEPGFLVKSTRELRAKRAIAVAAAGLVQPGTCIGISGGTTTHRFALELLTMPDLTVVTNSLPVAELFYERGRRDQTVLLTGGQRTRSMALVGPIAVTAVQRLHLDVLFLGTHGFDQGAKLTCPQLPEAQTGRAMAAVARRVIVLADRTKWGVTALATMLRLSEVDILVTDSDLDPGARRTLADNGVDLIVATSPDA